MSKKETLPDVPPQLWGAVSNGFSKERLSLFLQLATAGGLMMWVAFFSHCANYYDWVLFYRHSILPGLQVIFLSTAVSQA